MFVGCHDRKSEHHFCIGVARGWRIGASVPEKYSPLRINLWEDLLSCDKVRILSDPRWLKLKGWTDYESSSKKPELELVRVLFVCNNGVS